MQFVQLTDACVVLTGYYTDTRYPDSPETLEGYDADMAGEALLLASQVVAFVHEAIAGTTNPGSSA
jgi:HEPN domain-containing protein